MEEQDGRPASQAWRGAWKGAVATMMNQSGNARDVEILIRHAANGNPIENKKLAPTRNKGLVGTAVRHFPGYYFSEWNCLVGLRFFR